jgi:hypothetical protein
LEIILFYNWFLTQLYPDSGFGSSRTFPAYFGQFDGESRPAQEIPQQVGGEPTISMTALLELLKDADPEMKAKLRLALLT